tara:strand:- start:580 stop:1140 length:561 start_codon:yes stop_codon:yes gene_type:complete
MNIFRLHDDPEIAAQMHCDKHVVKMILETAQMLSTAWRMTENDSKYANEHGMYKSAHKNHPSTVWVRHGILNYVWTNRLFEHLCKEYTHRYGKHHASERLLQAFANDVPYETTIVKSPLPFPQCMPDQYKVEGDPVAAYRNYYKGEKAYFAKWDKGRASPEWWDDDMQDFVKHFATTEELLDTVGG